MKLADLEKARSLSNYLDYVNKLLMSKDLEIYESGDFRNAGINCPRFRTEVVKNDLGEYKEVVSEENVLIKKALQIKKIKH